MKRPSIASTVLAGLALGGFLSLAGSDTAHALGETDYLGSIGLVGENFCPYGTMEAKGQILAISQYDALFALFGWVYGGDGRTSFALPDMSKEIKVEGMRYCVVVRGIFPSKRRRGRGYRRG